VRRIPSLRPAVIAGLVLCLAQAACSAHAAPYRPADPPATRPAPVTRLSGPAARGGSGAVLRQADGGPDYYARFTPSFPDSPSFFPVGVWLAAVTQRADVTSDQAAGLNTYVTLTDNSDLALAQSTGMYLISNQPPSAGSRTAGWFVNDEADMWGGPGSAAWTGHFPGDGPICRPASSACGYRIQQTLRAKLPSDRRLRYANYGKGVIYWENWSQASKFIRDYQDVVSDDNYWFTDEDMCLASQGGEFYPARDLVHGTLPPGLCHLAANYGLTVSFIRKLAGYTRPVWAYIELGHPFTEGNWPTISPQQVTAAVWHSLIAGARGVIYFNHSFGGPCQTDNVLRDPCYAPVRAAVTRLDNQIRQLAPVLNAPVADGVVTASPGVDLSVKWLDGHFYILAGSKTPGPQQASFRMPCVGSATITVLQENRTVRAIRGVFTDRFSDANAVHIYRVDGGSSCGAY
jgi:hypothetical protein